MFFSRIFSKINLVEIIPLEIYGDSLVTEPSIKFLFFEYLIGSIKSILLMISEYIVSI